MNQDSSASTITKTQIYVITGFILLIISIPFIIATLQLALNLDTSADPEKEAKEVVVSNISSSSATISWVTGSETIGTINYGTAKGSLDLVGSDMRDLGAESASPYTQHMVGLRNLSPGTTYYYEVSNDGNVTVAAAGSFKTYAVSEAVSLPKTRKGKIAPAQPNALVYVFASNGRDVSEIRSTYTSSNGTFAYDISDLKTADGSTAFPLDNAKLVTYVNAEDAGKARVIHETDADAGDMTLDLTSTLNFTTDVDINTGDDTDPPSDPSPSDPPVVDSPVLPDTNVVGVDIMNEIYSDPASAGDPTVPTNVFVSNITETSFQINWITKEPTRGFVNYGSSAVTIAKSMLDTRDSSAEFERFTHSVIISDAGMVEGEKVYFYLVSNNKVYGMGGGTNPYSYTAPEILDSPPSPQALTGTLEYLPGSRLSSSSRDFLIYGKVKDDSGKLSTYVSTVPAYKSNGWSLSIGGVRNSDLSDTITASTMTVNVRGEYNSVNSETVTVTDDQTVGIPMDPGLSLDTIRYGQAYAGLSSLSGTASPDSTVNLSLAGQSYDTRSDDTGEWAMGVSTIANGDYRLSLVSGTQIYNTNFTIGAGGGGLVQLPVTAIDIDDGDLALMFGTVMIVLGLGLSFYIRRKNLVVS